MDKNELLSLVADLSRQGKVSREDLLAAFENGQVRTAEDTVPGDSRLSQLLYYVGGGIVFIGISILVGQQWSHLDALVRILLTLGVGTGFFVAAVFARQEESTARLAQAFFFLAGLLLPLGTWVTFYEAGMPMAAAGTHVLETVILFATFLVAYLIYPETVLLFFTIAFGSGLYFAVTGLAETSSQHFTWRMECYRSLVVFGSYLCLGYYYRLTQQRPALAGWLLGIGACGFLGLTLCLGGWKPHQSLLWEFAYPLLVFGCLYASIYLKHRAMLFFGAAYLVGYLGKITGEYFADSIGWPLALVVLGMVIILIGYWAIYLNKKYLRN